MEKKKFSYGKVLIFGLLIALAAFIVGNLVSNAISKKSQEISASKGISLITNTDDEFKVKHFGVVKQNDNGIVTMDVVDTTTNSTVSYTFTSEYDFLLNTKFYPIVKDTEKSNAENKTYYKLDTSKDASLLSTYLSKDLETTSSINGADLVSINTSVYKENSFLSWLPTIISFLFTLFIIFMLFRFLSSAAGGNSKALDFNKSRARRVDDSKIKFKDVAGCDEEKAEMIEIVDYLKEPKKFTKFGAKLPKGILLVGPPGTGKTLLAKAVAGEAGVPFYSISGSDFVEMFVGVGAGRVRDLFKTAKQNAPCVIFIDEIDAVGRQRGAGLGGGNDEREQTLNQLLVELDGFEDNSGVIVIAATNRADVLDPALLRAGRFDRQITVNLPDLEGREAIFKVHARNKKFDESVDFHQLAKRTIGFSGADIANILNEAAILAVRGKRDSINMADIDEAIDRRIAGIAKSGKGYSAKERKQIAFHEAGHAIIGLTLKDSDKVRKITIIPRGNTGGHVLMGPDEDRFLETESELKAKIVGYLGGRSSEEIFFKDVSTGASNDIEMATRIARSMVVYYGMSSLGPIQYEKDNGSVFLGRDYTNTQKNFSLQVADEIDKEVRKIIDNAHQEALKIINDRKDDVTLIANTLLEHETITEEQIDYLLKNRQLPPETVSQKDTALSGSNNLKDEEKYNENSEKPAESSENSKKE